MKKKRQQLVVIHFCTLFVGMFVQPTEISQQFIVHWDLRLNKTNFQIILFLSTDERVTDWVKKTCCYLIILKSDNGTIIFICKTHHGTQDRWKLITHLCLFNSLCHFYISCILCGKRRLSAKGNEISLRWLTMKTTTFTCFTSDTQDDTTILLFFLLLPIFWRSFDPFRLCHSFSFELLGFIVIFFFFFYTRKTVWFLQMNEMEWFYRPLRKICRAGFLQANCWLQLRASAFQVSMMRYFF